MAAKAQTTSRRPAHDLQLKDIAAAAELSQAEVRKAVKTDSDGTLTGIIVSLFEASERARAASGTAGQSVSISELHRLTGLDRSTIANRLSELEPLPGKKNAALYSLEAALPLLFEVERDLEAVKIRKLQAEAGMKEMEEAEMRGDLASREEFTETLQQMISRFYKRVVNQLPTELADPLLTLSKPAEVRSFLKERLGAEFDRLRDHYQDFL